MATPIEAVFLDDGGVINDNSLRGPRWQALVAEYFAPRLGGDPARWSELNRVVFHRAFERMLARLEAWQDGDRYERYVDDYHVDWLRSMCEAVGVAAPPADGCVALSRAAEDWIIPRVQADFPGAIVTVRELGAGLDLFTASSGTSRELVGHFEAMGIAGCFRRLYGPDLVDTPKNSVAYYERVFADAGVAPEAALVVDDSPRMLAFALEAGALGVLVGEAAAAPAGVEAIAALSELPALLRRLG